MRIHQGDTVFSSTGKPGIVAKKPANDTVMVRRDFQGLEPIRRNGFINGLKPEDRVVFEAVVQEAMAEENPKARLNIFNKSLEQLDPHRLELRKYLLAEKAHLMHSKQITPEFYTLDATRI